ncbi:hypothetical protein SLV14_007007 [Streptomyces sp. Je 1-4]|uniref:hypothetical protein n=1 Tax=Streptomyces TaxID=1883 RepID=UPI00140E9D32|nr:MULTISPECIES: hypothetical protein [unclassified Streptomyces]QIK04699.1 hypothetical protein G7Z12_33190 [Streptomyces sp. ID38640]UYB43964.1 hypothetical protein SLV14_007007 [Streptomyces sp. Je 1-4]UZQ40389.1 hypothetical protein SLV14N_007007 [Streptomyces sp. Je 1-4] [Streptomyces sp. Je 1-4 4N24]UZQ47806.1 hypothetical protein SLV14NA_007007 [Streptomyces sp. Je 1-4] [Streptomyces sp. Je 1-4 4N24_ara]
MRGASRSELVLPLADVRGTFLVAGLLTVGACAALLGGRLQPGAPSRSCGQLTVDRLR